MINLLENLQSHMVVMKEELIEKWKNQQSFVRLSIFTFLGGAIQFLVTFPQIWEFLITPIDFSTRPTNQLPPLLDSPYFVGIAFGITLLYSITTSMSFPQKRIVSPINIQIITWGLLLLIIPVALIHHFPTQEIEPKTIAVLGGYLLIVTIGFGLAQTILVKFVIGMNGNREDIEQNTFGINTDFDTVKKTLQSRNFRDLFYFKTPLKYRGKKELYVMKSDLGNSENILVVLKPDDVKTCILSIVSYESKYYQIQKTSRVKQKHEVFINELKKRLGDSVAFTVSDLDNDVSEFAYSNALNPTHNKLEHLKELSIFNKIALIGLGIIFGIITYLRFVTEQINQDSYISISIFVLIAVIIDLLPRFTRTKTELDY